MLQFIPGQTLITLNDLGFEEKQGKVASTQVSSSKHLNTFVYSASCANRKTVTLREQPLERSIDSLQHKILFISYI